ncbi:MAG: exopolyphosphatase [Desulfobacterales bacterium]|nr:exopolyphosphatase [Desulfobacterales bacterium]
MNSMPRYAAIDIGSNAVRLLLAGIVDINGEIRPKKVSWVRMPIRLGEDAFLRQAISQERAAKLTKTITGFRHLMEAYQPVAFKACATSAMRTAANGPDICKKIEKKTGIKIEIIDGKEEARFLFQNKHRIMTSKKKAALFIDVGGGSTEMTLFSGGRVKASVSFNIGTIRLMNDRVADEDWDTMKRWVKKTVKGYPVVEAIGSGGNINKLFKLAKGRPGGFVTRDKIEAVRDKLEAVPMAERMIKFNLKPDRADVILPGARIYLSALGWAGCEKVHVPMQGLADGMVRVLHQECCTGKQG